MMPPRATDVAATRADGRSDGRAGAHRSQAADAGRARLFRRRHNRRITVARPSLAVWLAAVLRAAAGKLAVVGKALAAVAFLAGAAYGTERAVRHVIASPRFALREVRVGPVAHVGRDEVIALAAVNAGDRLLAVDTDAVAARVASHPWVTSARVRRELPSVLAIDVTERHAGAAALLGTLYLLDDGGHPFKRATLEEADGLPVVTGLSREQYTAHRGASEAAFREALELLRAYAAESRRPALSEIHVDPRTGFSLLLLDGGGEIRLGRGDYAGKLARLDEILASVASQGAAAIETVHLDGAAGDRVAVRLAAAERPGQAEPAAAPRAKNFGSRANAVKMAEHKD